MDKYCTLLFLRRENQVLLAIKKRGFGANLFNGVGGKIDPGEEIEHALVRECQEEISVTPLGYHKVGEHDFLMDKDTDQPWHMYVHVYVATSWEGEPRESEEMRPQWFNIDQVPYEQMWQDDPFWLPQVLNGQFVVGNYSFSHDNTLLSHHVTTVTALPQTLPTGR